MSLLTNKKKALISKIKYQLKKKDISKQDKEK